jgi:hypothetical protein
VFRLRILKTMMMKKKRLTEIVPTGLASIAALRMLFLILFALNADHLLLN